MIPATLPRSAPGRRHPRAERGDAARPDRCGRRGEVDGEVVYRDAVLEQIAAALSRPRTAQEEQRRVLARSVFLHVEAFYDGYLDARRARRSTRRRR